MKGQNWLAKSQEPKNSFLDICWDFLNKNFEEFHKLEHQFQIDTFIYFLLQCASRIPEPTEELETDPQDNEKKFLVNKNYKNLNSTWKMVSKYAKIISLR